jgi:histidinol-phosphate aminotransferase
MKLTVPDYIRTIQPYKPGKPLEELEREYGIRDSIKLASNENPLGPSPKAVAAIQKHLANLHRYPDASGHHLIRKLAKMLKVTPEQIVLGNGSDDLIGMLVRTLLEPGDEVLMPQPSFLIYEIMARSVGASPIPVALDSSLSIDLTAMSRSIRPQTRMIFLCNPNNPTGTVIAQPDFQSFLEDLPSHIVTVVDEAYIEFVRNARCARSIDCVNGARPVVTLRTFSKAYGLAGLRIGYGIMSADLAGYLHRVRLPFNVSIPAQVGALAALEDTDFLDKTVALVHEGTEFLQRTLTEAGVRCFPTEANFFLIDVEEDADDIFEQMLRRGVIVRSMTSYGYPRYIRVNVGLPQENRRFVAALREVMGR